MGSRSPKRLKTLAFEAKPPLGNTLLHRFVQDNPDSENYNINAVLLSMPDAAGAVNALNGDGYTALHLAVLKGNHLMVKRLLSCLPNIDVDVAYRLDGRTALHIAAEWGYAAIVGELLNKGASVDKQSYTRETPLCTAAKYGEVDVMRLLVSKGADVKYAGFCSPMSRAVEFGRADCAAFLLDRGVDVNAAMVNGSTPLTGALTQDNLELVKLFVERGAFVNGRETSKSRKRRGVARKRKLESDPAETTTPLHRAVSGKNPEIVKLLVEVGADLNAPDKFGETPLHTAVRFDRNLDIVKLLVEKGADPNASDDSGRTPLHLAVRNKNLEIVKLLVEKGADWNAPDKKAGRTPLHMAACNKISEILKIPLPPNFKPPVVHPDSLKRRINRLTRSSEILPKWERLGVRENVSSYKPW